MEEYSIHLPEDCDINISTTDSYYENDFGVLSDGDLNSLFDDPEDPRKKKMKSKIKEVVQQVAEAQDLTIVEVLDKYPDLKLLLHKEEIEEKKKVIKEDKQLLKG